MLNRLLRTGKDLVQTLKKAYHAAFFSAPFSMVRKEVDRFTKQAVFLLKAKRTPILVALTTQEIIHNDRYLFGLSEEERKIIQMQYVSELHQPMAYIEEFPIDPETEGKNVFKIFVLEEKKMVSGTASYFMEDDVQTLLMLSKQELLRIAMAYYTQTLWV